MTIDNPGFHSQYNDLINITREGGRPENPIVLDDIDGADDDEDDIDEQNEEVDVGGDGEDDVIVIDDDDGDGENEGESRQSLPQSDAGDVVAAPTIGRPPAAANGLGHLHASDSTAEEREEATRKRKGDESGDEKEEVKRRRIEGEVRES